MSDTSLTQFEPRAARILVVDDEPANLKLLSLMLRTEGYQHVELVQDPRQVLTSYRAARPDLLLLDINMPHLDGYAWALGNVAPISNASPTSATIFIE
ncbi:MAG: response regulator [Steroidobacteraceae bacterium]|nr:response regulator [Steroidobacteraceae bacterium]